jgi:hypothetical protein
MSSDDAVDPGDDGINEGFPDFVPFSQLRGINWPPEMVNSRRLVDHIATAVEESGGDPKELLERIVPGVVGAVVGFESQILELRRLLSGS